MIPKKNKGRSGNSERGFMSNIIVLSLSTLTVKIIGLAFKIPMLSFLGTEGMGYFNSAYEIYALLCVISTAGLPVALSMTISTARARGSSADVEKIYGLARGLFLCLGLGGSFLMLCFAERLSVFIGNPNAEAAIICIAPALACICLASAIRGYCQGFSDMNPTALSQLIEAVSKLAFGVFFAKIALKNGYSIPMTAAFAVLGITLGTLLSLCYLFFARRKRKDKNGTVASASVNGTKVLKELIGIALPITLGSAVIGLTRIIDMTLIMRRLQDIGTTVAEANKIYGAYTTLAVPIFSLIPALITPVSMALVPQLSSYLELGDKAGERQVIENSMRVTVLLSMPASLGLIAFSRPILELLFSGQTEAIAISSPLLSILGTSVLFSCLITTTNAILQSYRRVSLPIISMTLGVIVKALTSYWLIGNRAFGAMGAPIGSLLCNLTVTLFNVLFMCRYAGGFVSVKKVFAKPLVASVASVGCASVVYVWLKTRMTVLHMPLVLAIFTAFVTYCFACRAVHAVTVEDIELLPFGDKIIKIARRLSKNRKANKGVEK